MTLRAVEPYDDGRDTPDYGHFEGEPVDGLRVKLTSATIELGDDVHRIDQVARLLVTGRVHRIDHAVEERSGDLLRIETFKVVDAIEVSWDAVSHLLGDEDEA